LSKFALRINLSNFFKFDDDKFGYVYLNYYYPTDCWLHASDKGGLDIKFCDHPKSAHEITAISWAQPTKWQSQFDRWLQYHPAATLWAEDLFY
jgi:hypothetical protein